MDVSLKTRLGQRSIGLSKTLNISADDEWRWWLTKSLFIIIKIRNTFFSQTIASDFVYGILICLTFSNLLAVFGHETISIGYPYTGRAFRTRNVTPTISFFDTLAILENETVFAHTHARQTRSPGTFLCIHIFGSTCSDISTGVHAAPIFSIRIGAFWSTVVPRIGFPITDTYTVSNMIFFLLIIALLKSDLKPTLVSCYGHTYYVSEVRRYIHLHRLYTLHKAFL